jgi:hypothetical protein
MSHNAEWKRIKNMIAGSRAIKLEEHNDNIISLPFRNGFMTMIEYVGGGCDVQNVFTGQPVQQLPFGPELDLYIFQLLLLPTPTLPEGYERNYLDRFYDGLLTSACNEYIYVGSKIGGGISRKIYARGDTATVNGTTFPYTLENYLNIIRISEH